MLGRRVAFENDYSPCLSFQVIFQTFLFNRQLMRKFPAQSMALKRAYCAPLAKLLLY